ncbi:transcription factor TGA2.3-like [Rutidosis leptorrhynchoides]|uniref:transcription factor TGA2.3-like n=1 Tax=Rutidosis leptorrhynchoides TaxID=125765 RepID=UPI003A99C0B1
MALASSCLEIKGLGDKHDGSKKVLKQSAKWNENSKRHRDRKQAYINDLEGKVKKQSERIDYLLKENTFLATKSDITNFATSYDDWSSKMDKIIITLTKQMSASSTDDLISPTIQQINDHYLELLKKKLQRFVLFLLLTPPGSNNKSFRISTLKKEADISNIMDRLKNNIGSTFIGKCFVDKGDYAAMSNYRNNMFEQMGKLTVFQDILDQADTLRAFNLKEIQRILMKKQTA